MMKKLALGIAFFILLVSTVFALSWTQIPNQTLTYNDANPKVIQLNSYASSDTVSYSYSCNSGVIGGLQPSNGVGYATNFTVYPVTNYQGSTNCTITAYDSGSATAQATVNIVVLPPLTTLSVPGQVTLGAASNQERDENVTAQFSITNTGSYTANNVQISSTAGSQYLVKFSTTQTGTYNSTLTISSLAAGASQTVYASGFVPSSAPSGLNVDIGDITIQSSDFASAYTISNLYINPSSKLTISDVSLLINNDKSRDVSEGGSVDKIEPDDKVEFKVEIENQYTTSEDVELNDVRFVVTIIDIDDGSDIDEKSDRFDIEAGGEEVESVFIQIPKYANRGNYEVLIEATGKDENGTRHEDKFEFTIAVERDLHRIQITKAELSKAEITTCSLSRSISLYVDVENVGRTDENNVKITAENDDLNIEFAKTGIALADELGKASAKHSVTIPITVPKNIGEGTYSIIVKSFFSDITSDLKTLSFIVSECPYQASDNSADEDEGDDEEPADSETQAGTEDTEAQAGATVPAQITIPASAPVTVEETKAKFTETKAYVALLVIVLLACIGAGIFIVVKYLMPQKTNNNQLNYDQGGLQK